jgi:hypothetical protein
MGASVDLSSIKTPAAPTSEGTAPEDLVKKRRLSSLYAQSARAGRASFFRNASSALPRPPKSNEGGLITSSTATKSLLGQ